MATKRQYPHVTGVADRDAQQSLRLLWDRVYAVDEARQADAATIATQAATISTLGRRMTAAERLVTQLQLQIGALGSSATPGSDDLVDPPLSGSYPPGPTAITFPGLGVVQVYASPDVSGWTETGTFSVTFVPGQLNLSISALGAWSAPGQTINIGGAQQAATIWLFRQIGGTWYGAGAERLRPNQTVKGLNAAYTQWPLDWWYNPSIWGPLSVVGVPGENVALLVTAGSTRLDNRTYVTERTPILQFAWPADGVTVTI